MNSWQAYDRKVNFVGPKLGDLMKDADHDMDMVNLYSDEYQDAVQKRFVGELPQYSKYEFVILNCFDMGGPHMHDLRMPYRHVSF